MIRNFKWTAPAGFEFTKEGYRCARCGSGFPCCAEIDPRTGKRFKHDKVCENSVWPRYGDNLQCCEPCEKLMEEEYGQGGA